MRRRLKMEVLGDYVSLFRIIYFCRCSKLEKPQTNINCQNIENLEERALSLRQKYDLIFNKLNIRGPSLILFRSQLRSEAEKEFSTEEKNIISLSKLEILYDKLGILESKHYSLSLKYNKKFN